MSRELSLPYFTQALVRRKLLGNDTYVSGVEAGTEVFKGTGRLDTRSYSVTIGRDGARRLREGWRGRPGSGTNDRVAPIGNQTGTRSRFAAR